MGDETFTTGDLIALRAIEVGMDLEPWQLRALSMLIPNHEDD